MSPPISPRRRAVFSPLVQRCTPRPTRPQGAVPRAVPRRNERRNAARLGLAGSSCLDQHPGRGHTDVMSTGGGRPLMTNTKPTSRSTVDRGAARHPGPRQERRRARPRRHPPRRRLGRRHAADRQPVHQRDGVLRQRPVDAAELPGRDPGSHGHAAGCQLLPAALRRPRHHDAGRRPRRPRGDEPGRAQGQPRRPARRWPADRRHRRVHARATWRRSATRATRSRTGRWRAGSWSACRSRA